MKNRALRLTAAGCVLGLAVAATSVAARMSPPAAAASGGASVGTSAGAEAAAVPPNDPRAAMQDVLAKVERLIATRPAELKAGSADRFVRRGAISTPWGLRYVSYDRTYQDLPVVGGDFVVTTDAQGNSRGLTVAQQRPIKVSRKATVSQDRAKNVARTALADGRVQQDKPLLVVYAGGTQPALAWETVVEGKDRGEPSRKKVYVDARTAKVLGAIEQMAAGTGTGAWNGAGLTIGTTQSGSTYTMTDPARPNLKCADLSTGAVFSGADNVWGSAVKTSKEAACVDVMYAAAGEWDMLKDWFGRNGLDGQGRWADAVVGLGDTNAFWGSGHNPDGVVFGYNMNREWITQNDVVAHEYGHGLDAKTPGGLSGWPTQEAVADIWATLTEQYLNNPNDVPDYEIGENVDVFGDGPIRYMYEPAKAAGHPNCYSANLPQSVHAAGGPMNHWFYLLAEGSAPGNGKPNSPTCNNAVLTGIGQKEAGRIFYNAMLAKTTGMTYPKWRLNTLAAAKSLDPTCAWHAKVKAAWNAVSLGAQAGEVSCVAAADDYTLSVTPTSASVQPGGSTTATVNTTIGNGSAQAIQLTASGLPTGATATFSPASLQSGTSSRLTITTSATTPNGTYDVRLAADGTSSDRTATFRLTVGAATTGTVTVTNPGAKAWFTRIAISPLKIAATSSRGLPITFKATGLPPGLMISATGVISGTPTTAGVYTVTVTATDSGGASGTTTFKYTIY
ncbi:M4 family metallopeptidase [Kribbella sp. NBC_01245]|uniref:M4 family metallopeptidase n=1 Tax=Kribbella sp. NBC_01245 TaxID=2903578 RepID=UPI002E2E46BF|nr:M4 family metallopeptidase [Kribbella sp. NBC_01245]